MNDIQVIAVPRDALPRGDYAKHVAEHGHEPGVLSGAEIRGRARQYGGWYANKRAAVAEAMMRHGVRSALRLDPERRRRVRVWTDTESQPIRIEIRD